jgi:hypothetical protein
MIKILMIKTNFLQMGASKIMHVTHGIQVKPGSSKSQMYQLSYNIFDQEN